LRKSQKNFYSANTLLTKQETGKLIKNSKKVVKEKGNRDGKYQMLVEIDDLDRKILALLQENSRVPFTQIAKELDVPDTTVHFRVKKLLENQVIRQFTIVVSPEKLGYGACALVRINIGGHIIPDISVERTKEIAEKLKKTSQVRFLATGDHGTSLYALILARSKQELENLLSDLQSNPDIQDLNVWELQKLLKGEEIVSPIPP